MVDFFESAEAFQAFVDKALPIFQEEGMPPIVPRIEPAVKVVLK
ncbi:hypothetical protein [Streptomyces sp. NPDC056527]